MFFFHQNQQKTTLPRIIFCVILLQITAFYLTTNTFSSPSFTASPTLGAAPLTVQFFDQSPGNITNRSWVFGDGETAGNVTSVSHIYQEPGTYTASLTVYFDYYPETATQTIIVTNSPDQPVLTSPEDGMTNTYRTPLLQTGPFSDDDSNERHLMTQWQISTGQSFSSIILDSTSLDHLTSLAVPEFILLENTTYYWRVRFYDSNSVVSDWSEIFSFTTLTTQNDQNSNGIPDALENSTVDLDNDGQADSGQAHIKSLNTAIGNGQMGVSIKGSSTITSNPEINAIDPETISQTSLPHSMPLGLFGMRLNVSNPGDTAEVVVYFSQAASKDAVWYLYDSVNGWEDYSNYASFSQDRKSVTLKFKDGDYGDADDTANGIIIDPGGFGVASWVKGFISDVSTNEAVTTATVSINDLSLDFNSFLDGNYLGMVLPGTYDFNVSAQGYRSKTVSNVTVSEASIVTKDVELLKNVKIKGLTISDTRQVFSPVTFSVDADSDASKLYYRFYVHPDYGTDDYNGLQWSSMTSTEWVTTSSIDYKFTSNGKYVVVVWVTSDSNNADTNGIAILGTSIEIGGTCTTDFTGFSLSGSQTKDTLITMNVNGQNPCSSGLYYRYSVHPYYGTDNYDGLQWTSMTSTEWWYNETIDYTFTEKGKYIVVVWATKSLSNIKTTGIPILGWSVDIE
jgi:PKD repeat protein